MTSTKCVTGGPRANTGDKLDCGHVLYPHAGIGTGYTIEVATDTVICYACANKRERELMAKAQVFTAYVDSQHNLTSWTGGLLARYMPQGTRVSRSGFYGSQIYAYRFRTSDGSEWYGRNAGPGTVITVRRAKHNLWR